MTYKPYGGGPKKQAVLEELKADGNRPVNRIKAAIKKTYSIDVSESLISKTKKELMMNVTTNAIPAPMVPAPVQVSDDEKVFNDMQVIKELAKKVGSMKRLLYLANKMVEFGVQ